MKRSCQDASNEFNDCQEAADALGIELNRSVVTCSGGNSLTEHWQFNEDNRRLLDWWPGNGKWRNPSSGETGTLTSPSEALEQALDVQRQHRLAETTL